MLSLTLGFPLLKHAPSSAFVSSFVLSFPNYVVTLLYNKNFILTFTKHTIRRSLILFPPFLCICNNFLAYECDNIDVNNAITYTVLHYVDSF